MLSGSIESNLQYIKSHQYLRKSAYPPMIVFEGELPRATEEFDAALADLQRHQRNAADRRTSNDSET